MHRFLWTGGHSAGWALRESLVYLSIVGGWGGYRTLNYKSYVLRRPNIRLTCAWDPCPETQGWERGSQQVQPGKDQWQQKTMLAKAHLMDCLNPRMGARRAHHPQGEEHGQGLPK